MMPSAKIVKRESAPPENMLNSPRIPPCCDWNSSASRIGSIPGTGNVRANAENDQGSEQEEQPLFQVAVLAGLAELRDLRDHRTLLAFLSLFALGFRVRPGFGLLGFTLSFDLALVGLCFGLVLARFRLGLGLGRGNPFRLGLRLGLRNGGVGAAARRFDRGARALAHSDSGQRYLARELARDDHLGSVRKSRHDACLFQRGEVDFLRVEALEVREPHLGGIPPDRRVEAALGQPALQRHLAALESDLVKAPRARPLPLVPAASRLARPRADAAA